MKAPSDAYVTGAGSLINVTSIGSHITVSPFPDELQDHLRYNKPVQENGKIVWKPEEPFTLQSRTSLITEAGYYSGIESFLKAKGYRVQYRRENPPYPQPSIEPFVFEGLTSDQEGDLKRMLKAPGGAVLRAQGEEAMAMINALVKAFSQSCGFIVAEEIEIVNSIFDRLEKDLAPLKVDIGLLRGVQADLHDPDCRMSDSGNVVVMTAPQLRSGLIRPEETGFLVFVDPPRKGIEWIAEMQKYDLAAKFAICNPLTKYPEWRRKEIEGVFGPTMND